MTVSYNDSGLRPNYVIEAYPFNPETKLVEVVRLSSYHIPNASFHYDDVIKSIRLSRSAWSHDAELLGGIVQTDNGRVTIKASELAREGPHDEYDRWVKWSWKARKIQVFIIAKDEKRSEGDLWFEAKITGTPSLSGDVATISFTDRLGDLTDNVRFKRFEGTASEPGADPLSVSGPDSLRDVLMPVLIGRVRGITPVTVNEAFQIHTISDRRDVDAPGVNEFIKVWDGINELIFEQEIVDEGDLGDNIPNGRYSTFSPFSMFALGAPPIAELTAEARGGLYIVNQTPTVVLDPKAEDDPPAGNRVGSEVYVSTAAQCVATILDYYGEVRPDESQKIARDEVSYLAMEADLVDECGIYLNDREMTRLEAISRFLGPFGYWVSFSDEGYAQFTKLKSPEAPAQFSWTVNDIQSDPVLVQVDEPWFDMEVGFGESGRYSNNLPVVQGGEIEADQRIHLIRSDYGHGNLVITLVSPLQGDAYITGQDITFSATVKYKNIDVTTEPDVIAGMVWQIGTALPIVGVNNFVQPASQFGPGSVNVRLRIDDFIEPSAVFVIEPAPQSATASVNFTVDGGAPDDPDPVILQEEWRERKRIFIHSLCSDKAGAKTISDYWLELHKVVRYTFKVVTKWNGYEVRIGAVVHLTHPRYGLEDGKYFVVIGIDYDSGKDRATVTLWG